MQIESFTKQNLPDVRKAIQTALDTVGKALRMEIKMGNISFNQADFKTKLEVKLPDTSGKVRVSEEEHERARQYAKLHNIQYAGRKFIGTKWKFSNGDVFRIKAINYKASKNGISITRISDNKPFKCPPFTIKAATQIRAGEEVPKTLK